MRVKYFTISFFFLSLNLLIYGQVELPKILPPSPNAASLGEYGQAPVGLFTGTPQINIPIHTIKSKNISIPISLNYNSNGIRVDQIASNVGLGWILNAGGVITRNIIDDADEYPLLQVPSNFPNSFNQETVTYLENSVDSESNYDTTSDNYSFNFNGYFGKFYLDENRTPILINPSPLKIEKTPSSTYAFKITDPNGTIYWFGNANSTEITMYQHIGSGQHGWSLENPTSWYLSKIEDAYDNFIEFTYSNYNNIYYSSVSQTVTATAGVGISGIGQGIILTKSNTKMAQLSSIVSSNGQASFTYSSNATGFNQLDKIEIRDSNNNFIKDFNLNYNVVTSSLLNLKNTHIAYNNEYGKRLFLTSITESNNLSQSNSPYLFSYYTPNNIPPRFSYAQDYWGYYNGVSNNNYLVSNGDYYLFNEFNTQTLHNIFSGIGANKEPNGNFGINGLLKTVTYPTKGFNEFMYEPHNYYGTIINYPSQQAVSIHIHNDADEAGISETVTTNTIPFDQREKQMHFSVGTVSCWEDDWPSHHIRANVTVLVADLGSGNFVNDPDNRFFTINEGIHWDQGNSLQIAVDSSTGYYIDLLENKRYRFIMRVPFECVRGDFNFSYYDQTFQEIQDNIEVGGLRISEVKSNDNNGNIKIKKYHYGDLSCIDCSSGVATPAIPAISYSTLVLGEGGSVSVTDKLKLTSSTLNNIYNKQGHQIGYESVIEEYGTDFEGGGVLNKYEIATLTLESPYFLYSVAGTPYNTSFGTGILIEKTIFKKDNSDFITLQKTENNYYNNEILNQDQVSYNTNLRVVRSGIDVCSGNFECTVRDYDIHKYYLKSQWHYINNTTNTKYDLNGQNPIITETDYFYNNLDHLQVTKTKTTTSQNNKTIITKIDYAHDLLDQELHMQKLIDANRIAEPIQTRTYTANADGGNLELLSTQKTTYQEFGANNLLLPNIIQTSKGTITENVPENRIIYHNYDDYGNPTEISKAGNFKHIFYIWGYNHSQPIAKIEGFTANQILTIQTEINTAISKSDLDDDTTTDLTGNEGQLRIALNAIRNHTALNNAMLTTFTYNPLIGVTSITDPKGDTQYYIYDDFNRLQYVKDQEGNILKENEYHYRN